MRGYRVAAGVRWAVEAGGVALVNDSTGTGATLGYPQAAIWDFLTRGEPGERIAARLCVVASLDMAAAQALVLETVAAWEQAGFLVPWGADG